MLSVYGPRLPGTLGILLLGLGRDVFASFLFHVPEKARSCDFTVRLSITLEHSASIDGQ
jgi:hypothetical protein